MSSKTGTGIYREWYLGGGEWTERELVGIERRMNRRAQTLAEYHAEPALPEQRRALVTIGDMMTRPGAA